MAGKAAHVGRVIAVHVLRGIWVSTMVLTPLFGFWLASSLAAYHNASQWLALLGGLALFPLLPFGWEAFYAWRRSKQDAPKKQILTRLDRLVLRTLVVNGAFLICMMWFGRATAFRALAVRGDWMLDGHDGAIASNIRGFLLGIADKLDSRSGERPREYGTSDEAPKVVDKPVKPVVPTAAKDPKAWPLPDVADAKVSAMPEASQTSIATVGAYLKAQFPDRRQRVKAIHDFIALRVTYDHDSLAAYEAGREMAPQDAETVFATRKGVCAGYSKLMVAIGAAASVEIKYVTGWIRDSSRRLSADTTATGKDALHGYRHAWNAVLIDDQWFLVDVTWDDPTGATEPVRSTYLFTPPELFVYDHLPEDPDWQLVMSPISLGDFARMPFLSPSIGELGVTLDSPKRSQVTVHGELVIELGNPNAAQILAESRRDGAKSGGRQCDVTTAGAKTVVRCELDDGEHEVVLYGAPASQGRSGRFGHLGSILVNSR